VTKVEQAGFAEVRIVWEQQKWAVRLLHRLQVGSSVEAAPMSQTGWQVRKAKPGKANQMTLVIIILLILILGGGGGYYGHSRWGYGGGAGIGLGTILLILLIAYLLGAF